MRLKHDFYVQLSCFVNSETIMSTQQLYNFTIKSLFCLSIFISKSVINTNISLNYHTKQFLILKIWKWSNIYIYNLLLSWHFIFTVLHKNTYFFKNLFEIKLWYFKCVSHRPYPQYLTLTLVYIIWSDLFFFQKYRLKDHLNCIFTQFIWSKCCQDFVISAVLF